MNAAEYERMFTLEDTYWWFVARHKNIEALIRERYGAPPGAESGLDILDIGCGTGAMSVRLKHWGRVVSADYSPLALEFCKRRGLTDLAREDAMCLTFAPETFDLIVVMDVLEHLPDDRAALGEFFRVLRPGGRVFATVPAYPHLWSEHDVALMHHRRYRKKELQQRFEVAGFDLEKLSHTMALLYPVASFQRRLNARRPIPKDPKAAMPRFPAPVNRALTGLVTGENWLARRLNLPTGLSLLTVAKKPGQPGLAK